MGRLSHDLGRAAEEAARGALSAAGFRLIESNWRCTGAELDIVCRDDESLVFAEVRARMAGPHEPSASIGRTKLRRLLRGARLWLARHGAERQDWRFVVVAVTLDGDGHATGTEIIEDPFVHLPEYHHGDP